MRKHYVNVTILEAKGKNNEDLKISISTHGHLYSKFGQEFDAKRSKEIWTTLYEMAKANKLNILKSNPKLEVYDIWWTNFVF